MIDIEVGKKYNRLTAIKFVKRNKKRDQYWKFKCECGGEKTIRAYCVIHGYTKSCGCISHEIHRVGNRTKFRQKKHGLYGTRTYTSWHQMKQRCNNSKNPRYKDYGGRGIKVCKEWSEFKKFYEDMGDRPENKTLDRIDCDGDYNNNNCKWSTTLEQAHNKRK
jgi:hypothetical protein